MVNFQNLKSEAALVRRIEKCLNKEHHGATKPEIDFIFDSLEKAYEDGVQYDVTVMRPRIMAFANNSTNQSEYCVKKVSQMKFKSDEFTNPDDYEKDTIVFFDIEVFPNLFVVVAKPENAPPIKMINPTSSDIEKLTRFKLVGFNNRRYDNHILYARMVGYDNQQLFDLSQKIISGSKNASFAGAYGLTDREKDVFTQCVTTEAIGVAMAAELSMSRRLLQKYIASIYEKTGTESRVGLLRKFYEMRNGENI